MLNRLSMPETLKDFEKPNEKNPLQSQHRGGSQFLSLSVCISSQLHFERRKSSHTVRLT